VNVAAAGGVIDRYAPADQLLHQVVRRSSCSRAAAGVALVF